MEKLLYCCISARASSHAFSAVCCCMLYAHTAYSSRGHPSDTTTRGAHGSTARCRVPWRRRGGGGFDSSAEAQKASAAPTSSPALWWRRGRAGEQENDVTRVTQESPLSYWFTCMLPMFRNLVASSSLRERPLRTRPRPLRSCLRAIRRRF